MHVHCGGELEGAADEVAGRGGGEDEAFLRDALTGAGDRCEWGAACFGDGAEGFFDDVGEAAFFVAGGGVGAAVDEALVEVIVVPGHLVDEISGYGFACCAGCEEVDGVADFGDFGEHYCGSGANEEVGCIAYGWVGGDSGEGVAASALQADD